MQSNLNKNNKANTISSFSNVHKNICMCVFLNRKAIKDYILVKILRFKKRAKN